MKTYLAVFTGNQEQMKKSGWLDLAPEERKAREEKGMAAWGKWMAENADTLVFEGGPLGKTKEVSKAGVKDIVNSMAGLVVFTAASHEDAARKFESHPHFTIFPGDGVEIMEVLPIPGQ
jgi:alkanesulfonate monooxygenase SsuD/methylene tetrahydromethanopterin reductase-like flavin-dependent oxidoreductase (luciferase family)